MLSQCVSKQYSQFSNGHLRLLGQFRLLARQALNIDRLQHKLPWMFFGLQNLPVSIQLSSVKSVLPIDINEDGKIDLVIGGNEFGFQPQLGRLDASKGDILINDSRGNFSVLNQMQSGIAVQGQVRDLVLIKRNDKINILFLQNNELPVLYEVIQKKKLAIK